jgi:hypothetical protein
MLAVKFRHHQLPAQRQLAFALGFLPVPYGRVVFVHDRGLPDRHYVLYRESTFGVHIVDVDVVVWRAVCAVFDSAECDGIIWACEGAGEILVVESYRENLINFLELYVVLVSIHTRSVALPTFLNPGLVSTQKECPKSSCMTVKKHLQDFKCYKPFCFVIRIQCERSLILNTR